jgi:adenine deaminase
VEPQIHHLEPTLPRIKSTLLLWVIAATSGLFAQHYDVLIRNGRLVDGSGNPWTYADVGVIGDRVAFVGRAGQG